MLKNKKLVILCLIGSGLQAADDFPIAQALVNLLYKKLPEINSHGISDFRIAQDTRRPEQGYVIKRGDSGRLDELKLFTYGGVPEKITGGFGSWTRFMGNCSYDNHGGDMEMAFQDMLKKVGIVFTVTDIREQNRYIKEPCLCVVGCEYTITRIPGGV